MVVDAQVAGDVVTAGVPRPLAHDQQGRRLAAPAVATRLVADPLSKVLGQPVVVENRPGANSIVGAAAAASSPPDGYTLVMVLPAHAANATLQAGKLPFDPTAGFAPVSLVVTAPLEGFLHEFSELDTLGQDRPGTACTAFE